MFAGLYDRARNSPGKFTGDSLRRLLALNAALISYGDAQQIVERIEVADGGTVEAALEADGITAEAAGLARE